MGDLVDTFQLHPGLTVFAILISIPLLLAFIGSGLILLLTGVGIVAGLIRGRSLALLLEQVDVGQFAFVFFGTLGLMVALLYIPLCYMPLSFSRKK